jgi:hypothetical protein
MVVEGKIRAYGTWMTPICWFYGVKSLKISQIKAIYPS